MAETGPTARLAFFCEEHLRMASLAPMAAVEDADTYSCAGDGVLAAVWESVSDRYPDPVRLVPTCALGLASHPSRAGISSGARR
jgi:hypothetical protein